MGWGYGLYQMKDRGTPNEKSNELVYWHKFDDIWNMRPFRADDDMIHKPIKMSRDDIKGLLQVVSENPDYWASYGGEHLGTVTRTDGFSTVETMCEILYLYDQLTENGWEIVFIGS